MIEIEGVIYLTTKEAAELAEERGHPVTVRAITNAAREGNIIGARKLWANDKAPWIISRDGLLEWIETRKHQRKPGPKKD